MYEKKVEIEVDIEDSLYIEMLRLADEKSITVDELAQMFVKQGLEEDIKNGIHY